MTDEAASKMVLMLLANWPNTRAGAETLRLYEQTIRPLDATDAEAVVMEIIATSEAEFLPKPATICRMVAERRLAVEGRVMLTGEEAWTQVQDAIRRCGYYSYPGSLHPRILRAIDAIGWRELCTSENIEANRAHFFRIFNAVQQREVSDQVGRLVGSDLGWLLPDRTTTPELKAIPARAAALAPPRARSETTLKPLAADLEGFVERMSKRVRS
jgi:hypothetical protein